VRLHLTRQQLWWRARTAPSPRSSLFTPPAAVAAPCLDVDTQPTGVDIYHRAADMTFVVKWSNETFALDIDNSFKHSRNSRT
jgi:hypothetical protein